MRGAATPHGAATVLRRGVTPATLVVLLFGIGATDWLVSQPRSHGSALLVKALLAVAFLGYSWLVLGLSPAELGLAPRDARRGLAVGGIAAACILVGIVVLVVIPASRGHFTTSRVHTDSASLHWLEPLVFIPIGTVLFEELVFRGILLGAALRRFDQRIAVAVTSVVFGLWHLPDVIDATGSAAHAAGDIVGTVAVTMAAGVIFAVLRLRSSSLVAPVLAHLAFDAGAYAVALWALKLWG